jgi:hypothetical protein
MVLPLLELWRSHIPESWNANLIAFAASWLQPAKLDDKSLLMSYQTCGQLPLFGTGALVPNANFLILLMKDRSAQRTSNLPSRAPEKPLVASQMPHRSDKSEYL